MAINDRPYNDQFRAEIANRATTRNLANSLANAEGAGELLKGQTMYDAAQSTIPTGGMMGATPPAPAIPSGGVGFAAQGTGSIGMSGFSPSTGLSVPRPTSPVSPPPMPTPAVIGGAETGTVTTTGEETPTVAPTAYDRASRLQDIRTSLEDDIRARQATLQQDIGRGIRETEQALYTQEQAQMAALTGYASGTQEALRDNLSAAQMQTLTDFYSQARAVSGELAAEVNNVDFAAMAQLSGMEQTELQSAQIQEAMAPLLKARYDVQLAQGVITEEQYEALVAGVQPYIDLAQTAGGEGATGGIVGTTDPTTGVTEADPVLTTDFVRDETGEIVTDPETGQPQTISLNDRLTENLKKLDQIFDNTLWDIEASFENMSEISQNIEDKLSEAGFMAGTNANLFRTDEEGNPLASIASLRVDKTKIGQGGFNDTYTVTINNNDGSQSTLEVTGTDLAASVLNGAGFVSPEVKNRVLKTIAAMRNEDVINNNAFEYESTLSNINNQIERAFLAYLQEQGYVLDVANPLRPYFIGDLAGIDTYR